MPNYNNSWSERVNNELFRENVANIFNSDSGRVVYDSKRLGGMTIEEVVSYINLAHNAIDTVAELNDTNIDGITGGQLLYYEGTSGKWSNASELPLDFHISSTSGSREFKIESESGATSTQTISLKQPDVEWKIQHQRLGSTSHGLRISDGTNKWKFETTGAIKFPSLSSEPSEHNEGSLYFNNDNNNFYVALEDSDTPPGDPT